MSPSKTQQSTQFGPGAIPRARQFPLCCILEGSGPQSFWHQGLVSWKTVFPWARKGAMVWGWFKHITFIVHCTSIIITSSPPQIIRHQIPEVGEPCHRGPKYKQPAGWVSMQSPFSTNCLIGQSFLWGGASPNDRIALFYFFNCFFKNFIFCIGVSPINNVVIVSDGQQRDSVIHIHVSILPQAPLPSKQPHSIEQSFLWYVVGPCWLSILNYSSVYTSIPNSPSFPSGNHKFVL